MTRSFRMQPVAKLSRYFNGNGNPEIVSTFTATDGWKPFGMRKRVSGAYLRKLRGEGVQHIAVRGVNAAGVQVTADFSIAELLRR